MKIVFPYLFFVMLTVACTTQAEGGGEVMNDTKVRELQRQAAMGDSSVAIDLFHFFLIERNDPDEARFWLRLSAEQGSCEGMIEYGRLLGGALGDKSGKAHWTSRAMAAKCENGD